jgi:hypothetical protein
MKTRLLLLAACAALWQGTATADVYKCRDADGRIEITIRRAPAAARR